MSTQMAPVQDEHAKVESWRMYVLAEAGFPLHLCERMAASEIDIHEAVKLVKSGCKPETAAEILL